MGVAGRVDIWYNTDPPGDWAAHYGKTDTTNMRSPIKYFGGKHYLAPVIIQQMQHVAHCHYVEPFFGGGSVLFARDPNYAWNKVRPGCSECINDINSELTNFWRVLQDTQHSFELQKILHSTPYSEPEFALAQDNYRQDVVRQAANFFIVSRQSFAAARKTFAPIVKSRTRGGINDGANAWLGAIDMLPEIHARLRGVVILQRDAVQCIESQDSPQTLFYCDPPYVHSTRVAGDEYAHEMSDQDHLTLLTVLNGLRGKFILSGYANDMYNGAAERCGWRHFDIDIDNKAAGGNTKRTMQERVWANF